MQTLDLVFVAGYFLLVALVGWRAGKVSGGDSSSYFLAGRGAGWGVIGASLFASNISAEHFIGLAGSGASGGLAVGQFEWLACFILLLLGWLFVPFYLRTGVFTMPEFLEKRYGRACRVYLAVISLVAYVFTKISVAVYAGALVLKTIAGFDLWTGALLLLLSTGAYTMFGGLLAVLWTDFFQAFVLIGGGLLLTAIGLDRVGGIAGLLAATPPSHLSVWLPADHPELPWTGILFGAPILGIWYWCTDQMIVQRTLAAHDIEEARTATLFAGFLKILPVFLLVVPGLCGRILFPETPANQMYARLVHELLPVGVKGFVVAGLLAALMSSLSSVFNSSSTLVVMDFYRPWRPGASEAELVKVGQFSTLVLVIVGVAWIPFVDRMGEQLYLYLQSVQAYVSPPIATVFLAGILWPRANATGALAALLVGFLVGGARFVAEILLRGGTGRGTVLEALAAPNFLHFAVFLAVLSAIVLAAASLATPPPPEASVAFLQAGGKEAEESGASRRNRILSGILVAIVLCLWVVFSPLGLAAPRS